MHLFDLIELPFCKIILIEAWNAPAHRYFLAYRAQDSFRHVLGLAVVDEFATFSSPIFFAPAPILGKIYNAGVSLGHLRDPEMAIDTGWPPLCVCADMPASELPEKWEEKMLDALKSGRRSGHDGLLEKVDDYSIRYVEIHGTSVYATDAPLLPKQLQRICQLSKLPFSIAFATGNRITRQHEEGTPLSIRALSEASLKRIAGAFEEIGRKYESKAP